MAETKIIKEPRIDNGLFKNEYMLDISQVTKIYPTPG